MGNCTLWSKFPHDFKIYKSSSWLSWTSFQTVYQNVDKKQDSVICILIRKRENKCFVPLSPVYKFCLQEGSPGSVWLFCKHFVTLILILYLITRAWFDQVIADWHWHEAFWHYFHKHAEYIIICISFLIHVESTTMLCWIQPQTCQ